MDIAVALDRTSSRRDIVLSAGDTETLVLTVYREDGDATPLTVEVTNPAINFQPDVSLTIPVGTEFTVPDNYDRVWYRLTADIDGKRRTLCCGTLVINGGQCWPNDRWDYGGPW